MYVQCEGILYCHAKSCGDQLYFLGTTNEYITCSGGVPSATDVKSAIDDLEELYKAIEVNGKLSDAEFDFMKSDLTVKDMVDIKSKLDTQPPKPDLPLNANVFQS